VPLNLVVPNYQSIDAISLAMLTALVGFALPSFSQDKPVNNLESSTKTQGGEILVSDIGFALRATAVNLR